jgi:hypothetical protein
MSIDYKDLMDEITSYYSTYSQYINEASFQRSFGYGVSQWRQDQRNLFDQLKMPTLQKNELAKHIKSAVAEFAANPPDLEVKCYNPDTDPQVVKQYQKLVRTIEEKSGDAKLHAYEDMLRTGLSPALFLSVDYENDHDFAQTIEMKYIDYEAFYFDVAAQHPTKKDGDFVGYLRRVSKDYFERTWPKSEPNTINVLSYTGTASDQWIFNRMEEEVIIAHHFKKEWGAKKTIYLTNSNRTVNDQSEIILGEEIIGEREIREMEIKCYILNGDEILEKPKTYPVNFLPLVGCKGYQALIKGQIFPYSYGHEVHDMQRLQNFTMSQVGAAALYLRRNKTIWDKATVNQQTMNTILNNTAPSDVIIEMGKGKPPLHWPSQDMSATLLQLYEGTSNQIDATLGRYETAQGAGAPTQAGIAKEMEINQANLPIYYYLHPMITALNRVGEILNQLIPEVYINPQPIANKTDRMEINTGEPNTLNFSDEFAAEDYHIYIKAGASFTIQRETYRKSMDMIYSRAPQELQLLLAPMMFELMDVPNLPRLEDIYKKFIALTQPQLYQLLQDVPTAEIEQKVQEALQTQQQQQGEQSQMAQSMQQMAMQKEHQTMLIAQMKVELDQQKLRLDQQELALKERAQEAEELENTTNYQIRTEEIDQRERDSQAEVEKERIKAPTDLLKNVLEDCLPK